MAKVGRPTKYKEAYCKEIINYFSIEHAEEVEISHINTKGEKWTQNEFRANALPTIEGFCAKIGVDDQTIIEWTLKHKDFFAAYTQAKQLQKDMLLDNGLTKRYDGQFSKFVAINCCGMVSEKAEITGKDGEPVLSLAAFLGKL